MTKRTPTQRRHRKAIRKARRKRWKWLREEIRKLPLLECAKVKGISVLLKGFNCKRLNTICRDLSQAMVEFVKRVGEVNNKIWEDAKLMREINYGRDKDRL